MASEEYGDYGKADSVSGSWNCLEGLVRVGKGVEGQERCVGVSGG